MKKMNVKKFARTFLVLIAVFALACAFSSMAFDADGETAAAAPDNNMGIGMIAAVIIQLSLTNYAGSLFGVSWQAILIGLASFAVLYFGKWSVSKTILLSAGLGLILGGL